MKLELLIIAITAFFAYDIFKDNHYSRLLKSYKKYYQMAGVIFAGLSMLIFFKKHPFQSKGMLASATQMIKYMPIDKSSTSFIEPFLSFYKNDTASPESTPQGKRMMASGSKNGNKRCVSETKKKFVASRQNWACNACSKQLPAWFEVDHVVRLEHGGTNHIDNLVALCRDCHGRKTAIENM